MAYTTTPVKPHRQDAPPERVGHYYNQWRLRHYMKTGQIKYHDLIVKTYAGMPGELYTRNRLVKKEFSEWGLGF